MVFLCGCMQGVPPGFIHGIKGAPLLLQEPGHPELAIVRSGIEGGAAIVSSMAGVGPCLQQSLGEGNISCTGGIKQGRSSINPFLVGGGTTVQ